MPAGGEGGDNPMRVKQGRPRGWNGIGMMGLKDRDGKRGVRERRGGEAGSGWQRGSETGREVEMDKGGEGVDGGGRGRDAEGRPQRGDAQVGPVHNRGCPKRADAVAQFEAKGVEFPTGGEGAEAAALLHIPLGVQCLP